MPYIVPGPTPAPQTGFGNFAQGVGTGIDQLRDILLQALLSGQIGRQATGGQFISPTGQQTMVSPAEQVRGQPQMRLAELLQRQVIPQGQGSFLPTTTQGGRVQFLPPLTRRLQETQLQQAQSELAEMPLKRRKLTSEIRLGEETASWLARQSGAGAATPQMDEAGVSVVPQVSTTEQMLSPTPLAPGQALVESGTRTVGRMARMREVQKGLTDSYKARTAVAARALGDAANIAVEERKILEQSFPQDGDTYQSRLTKEQSAADFFDQKEAELAKVARQPTPQILKGVVNGRPRFEADPALMASKKKAIEGLAALQQTRVMYQQMYREANEKMPPIGAMPRAGVQTTPSGLTYTLEE